MVDLERQFKFPKDITKTTLRPNMKSVVMLELTVPWKDRVDEAFEWKREGEV